MGCCAAVYRFVRHEPGRGRECLPLCETRTGSGATAATCTVAEGLRCLKGLAPPQSGGGAKRTPKGSEPLPPFCCSPQPQIAVIKLTSVSFCGVSLYFYSH